MKKIAVPEEGIETLFGSYDENLKLLESLFNVRIRTQGHDLLVEGDPPAVERVERVVDQLSALMFRLGASVVEALAQGVPVEPLARYFEYWLLRLQGVYEQDARLSADARAFLATVRAASPFALVNVAVSARTLAELERAHQELIALHLEKDLKSVRVLREMRR